MATRVANLWFLAHVQYFDVAKQQRITFDEIMTYYSNCNFTSLPTLIIKNIKPYNQIDLENKNLVDFFLTPLQACSIMTHSSHASLGGGKTNLKKYRWTGLRLEGPWSAQYIKRTVNRS